MERTVSATRPPQGQINALAQRFGAGFWPDVVGSVNRAVSGLNASFTSWYRTATHNEDVGGVAYSQHRYGTAFDVVVPRANWGAAILRLRGQGFKVIDEGDHIHAQVFSAGWLPSHGIYPRG
jgi:hypothetical protein